MALHALTRRFVDYLDREKRRLGVVDFDDLLLRTLAVLEKCGHLPPIEQPDQFAKLVLDFLGGGARR